MDLDSDLPSNKRHHDSIRGMTMSYGRGVSNSSKRVGAATVALVLLSGLAGCSGSNPEVARDQKIQAIQDALRSGSGSDFCIAINQISASACAGQIIDSAGLANAELKQFPISETDSGHSIEGPGFSIYFTSSLFEFESGEEFIYSLSDLTLPQVSVPNGGSLDGNPLKAGETYFFMPSDEPGTLVPNVPDHGYLAAEVLTSPWLNNYPIEFGWSPDAEQLAVAAMAKECSAVLEARGYDTFYETTYLILDYKTEFKRAATNFTTFYDDGTSRANSEARYVNSPSDLEFTPCVAERVVVGDYEISIEWSSTATFNGTVGLQTERNTFGDDYTGEYEDLTFAATLGGQASVSLTDTSDVRVSIFEVGADMPLATQKR